MKTVLVFIFLYDVMECGKVNLEKAEEPTRENDRPEIA
jgi:hypothetical protein